MGDYREGEIKGEKRVFKMKGNNGAEKKMGKGRRKKGKEDWGITRFDVLTGFGYYLR